MNCLNLSIPQIDKDYKELTEIFSNQYIAYALLSKNNSYNLDLTPSGAPSKLYDSLMSFKTVNQSRSEAIKLKARLYTSEFTNWFGKWNEENVKVKGVTDTNGEPAIVYQEEDRIPYFRLKQYEFKPVSEIENYELEQAPINLKQGSLHFLEKENVGNIDHILASSTAAETKYAARMVDLLSESTDEFNQQGLFIHYGDPVIAELNANLFKELVDEKSIIPKTNERFRETFRSEQLAGERKNNAVHNVISTNKYRDAHWLVSTDDAYTTKQWDFASDPKRRERILQEDREWIQKENLKYLETTGKEAIKIQDIKTDGVLTGIVTFDEQAMKEYNAVVYSNYINSMNAYFYRDEDVSEDFNVAPLAKKIKQERKQLRREKANLEISGGKQSEINKLENKIEGLSTRLKAIVTKGELTDIYAEAAINLKEIKEIIQSNKLNPAQFEYAINKLQMWIKAGSFDEETHIFLDEEMLENEEIRNNFSEIRRQAELVMPSLMTKGKNLLANIVNEQFGTKLTYDEVVNLPHKLNSVSKNVLSLNRQGQALAQYITNIVNEANDNAFREAKIESRYLIDLYKKVKEIKFNEKLFYQTESVEVDGVTRKKITGRLVHKFSQKYFNTKSDRVKFRRESEFTINPLLLKGTPEERAEHIQEIESHLGKIGAKEYIDKAETRYENYLKVRQDHIAVEYGTEELTEAQKGDLYIWELQNSPIERIKAINQSKHLKLSDVVGKDTFLVVIPKKINNKGVDLGFYDESFSQIENNPIAHEFYLKAKEITNNAQILFGSNTFTSTSLAFVEQSTLAKLSKLGVAEFLSKEVFDAIISGMQGKDSKKVTIDPITGKPVKSIRPDVQTIDKMIVDLAKKKRAELEISTGVKLKWKSEEMNKLLAEASDEILTKMTFDEDNTDLFKSLNLLNLAALNYKHASLIEDAVNMSMTYLPKSTVNTGNDIVDHKGNPVADKYIDNLVEMAQYFVNNQYYKEARGDNSAKLWNMMTSEDKKYKAKLEEKLKDKNLTEEESSNIKTEIGNLGKQVTVNSLFRNLMGWMRLKGMGWNIPAGIVNLAYGKITNMYKAFDGRMYTAKEWASAEKAIVTDWTKFNKVTENYNIIGDILYEFKETNKFDESDNWFMKTIKAVKPYALQTATEKSNQGTVMIAMMMHQQVTNSKGETKSLWEAIDANGSLSKEWSIGDKSGDAAIGSMVSKIKNQIWEIHGDYSNPLMIKDTLGGQAISMFRLWFFEAYHSRFGYEKQDFSRGIATKGRYRTMWDLGKQFGWNPKAFRGILKNNVVSEVDKANLKVNIAEAVTMSLMYMLYAILKKSICGDEEKCRSASLTQLALLNMGNKLMQDTAFYINPSSWANFIKNPTAMTGLLEDVYKLYDLSYTSAFGDEKDLTYKSGRNKDRGKWEVYWNTQLPLLNSVERTRKYGEELFGTKP